MDIHLDKKKSWGILVTILFHTLLLFILFMLSLKPPFPARPEIGLEVNIGNSDQGYGEINTLDPSETTPTPPKNIAQHEKVATQNTEESVKLNADKKPKPTPEQEKPKVDSKFIFTKSENKQGQSEGNTSGTGNMGNPNGSITSSNYSGMGGSGNTSWKLDGRGEVKLPKPQYNTDEQGTVVVRIQVNRDGKVINAQMQPKGTTISSNTLQKIAIDAALKAVFTSKPDAPEIQTGTITYQFVI